jgi:multidrug efflux pump subunit AcrA (membrane-fusion protein)
MRLGVVQARLADLNERDEALNLRASVSGTVIQAQRFAEGMVSNTTAVIARVAEQTLSFYRLDNPIAESLAPGDVFLMEITQGTLTFNIIVEVVEPAALGVALPQLNIPHAYLIQIGGDIVETTPGAAVRGRINYVHGEVKNVVAIPLRAVRGHDGQPYVYIMENGIRKQRFVEIGLNGGGMVEIVSGLEAGEVIVL